MTQEERPRGTADLLDRESGPKDERWELGRNGESRPADASAGPGSDSDARTPLLSSSDSESFRRRWTETQTTFVDEPRGSVETADALVAELMQTLAASFANERSSLEEQWEHGEDVDTEELRNALRRYRSFFERLLAVIRPFDSILRLRALSGATTRSV